MTVKLRDISGLASDADRSARVKRIASNIEVTAPWMFAAATVTLLCGVGIVGLSLDGGGKSIDERILLALRSPLDAADPIGPTWFEGFMRDVTALGGFGVISILVLSVTGFLFATGRRSIALRIFAISLSGWLISHGVKFAVQRPRPDLVPHGAEVISSSFPSGHAMTSAVVYLTLGAALAATTADVGIKIYVMGLAIAITLLVGVSRVYLGVHWPTDVLGGWALGGAWVGVAWMVTRWADGRAAR